MRGYFNCTAEKNKAQSWRHVIAEMFGPADIGIDDEKNFFGEIRRSPLGHLDLTEVASSFENGQRTRSHLVDSRDERFLVVFLKSGRLHISQFGRECDLAPGMFTLFDCSAPYVFRHTEPTRVINVALPGGVLRSRLRNPARFIAEAKSSDCALGRIVSGFVDTVAREAHGMPHHAASQISVQLADLIAVTFDSADDDVCSENSAVQAAIYRRCTAFIAGNLGEPRLDPAMIAAAAGISVRYLHAVFKATDETVGEFVRRSRLARAYDALLASASRTAVKEVAHRHGFRNPAHFATAFKSHFGVSPSDVRKNITQA